MKKIKIVHIINNLGVGGAERVLLILLEELSKRTDLEITLISLEGHGELEESFKKLPINFKKFNYHLFNPILRRLEPYFRFKLYLFVKKLDPDIIHGHLIKGEDFAKVLGGLLRKPVFTTSHDCYVHPGRKQKWLNRYLTEAIAVSPEVKDHLVKYYELTPDRIKVIPDGIKVEDFKNSGHSFDPQKPIFIYLGRLIDVKGVQYAIRGLNKLKAEYPGVKMLVFGDGWYRSNLESLVRKLNADFVSFKGRVEDVPSALKQGDIFVLPSRSEGFSMATLEAAAAGKPLLASKTGAIPEILKEGKNGFFVKYGDSESVYRAAKRVLAADYHSLSVNSLKMAKVEFSIGKVAEMYYNLYSKRKP